ncbi:hypothetical protein N3114_05415 [Aliarcobacter butzleri]|uniref:hypothetical protein n=1 Tax=Aliarcobacter butzleri TaxID=28197 RepID=UPI0021B3DC30|nr:hypothetical protein [Aliarcobacter butzleri]UXC30456.1 hypothetical protein N3114_05415 [Aliarcobacter butzleri]
MKNVYLLQERDCWYSDNHICNLGIFTTLNKAIKAAKSQYGELEKDGSFFNYVPSKNPNDVAIHIIEVELNALEEF